MTFLSIAYSFFAGLTFGSLVIFSKFINPYPGGPFETVIVFILCSLLWPILVLLLLVDDIFGP